MYFVKIGHTKERINSVTFECVVHITTVKPANNRITRNVNNSSVSDRFNLNTDAHF
jgi:hypothetical protein